ncbi:MAG TPA: hypothetical protein PLU33_08240 [Treponemataceae bacterium]|nr:hypothetical protein [Spirochaetaceae bacterium]HQL05117.1 hypothetical protein [Treponemataceae bacterium]
MKKNCLILMLILVFSLLQAQNTDNQKKFILGSIADKTSIISSVSDAADVDNELLLLSLKFCIESKSVLAESPELHSLLLKTLSSFKNNVPSYFSPVLLNVYKVFPEKDVTIALFHVLSRSEITDASIVQDMYSIVKEETQKHFSQRSNELLIASITALGTVHDSNLFNNLFPCLLMDLDSDVASLIFSILSENIQRYKADSIKVISGNNIVEKRLVFDIAEKSTVSDDFFKAEIAENTLSSTINNSEDALDSSRDVINLQLDSMRVIRDVKWTRSSLLITKYFSLAQDQYRESYITREELIEIIDSLTSLATSETGKALTDYLGILNGMTEKTGTYDEVLLLSVIRSIGKLGEKSAFDNLLYVILYQGYSEKIISASKEALAKLNW